MGRYYVNDIAHCTECKAPLEIKKMFLGKMRNLPVMCECQKKEYEEFEERKRKRQNEEYISSIKSIGIPDEEYRKWRFSSDDMRLSKISNVCRKYCKNWDKVYKDNHGIIMYGDVGTGKTFYAACIVNELAEMGINVLMTNIPVLISKMGSNFESEKELVLKKISSVPLLVLDDFGVERASDYTIEKTYEIIDTRYRSGKPVIITTNQDAESWFKCRDIKMKRIYSRIREMCSIVLSGFTGSERRYENYIKKRDDIREIMRENK